MTTTAAHSFYDALSTKIPESDLASKAGLTYISAAGAMRAAGRPIVEFVDFNGKPYLDAFGGALVAIDIVIPGTEITQRTWLPVMDNDNYPLKIDKATALDINKNRQRALAKAISCVYGNGMSLYLNCAGDGEKAANLLGVKPETDLAKAKATISLLKENGAPYVEWGVGLAVCRITDPTFYWDILEWDGLPYREVLGGIIVDVRTVYRGKAQTLSLPVMDSSHKAIPASKVNVNDWNKACMRALTKCIAYNTGYGLNVYVDDFGLDEVITSGSRHESKKSTTSKSGGASADSGFNESVEELNATAEKAAAEKAAAEKAAAEKAAAEKAAAEKAAADKAAADKAAAEKAAADKAAAGKTATVDCYIGANGTAWPKPSSDAKDRFRGVMANRKDQAGAEGLLSLFSALQNSNKFANEDKPGCWLLLLSVCALHINGEHIDTLLANVKSYNALQYLSRDVLTNFVARVTAEKLNTACEISEEALAEAPAQLVEAGLASSVDEVITIATSHDFVTEKTLTLLEKVTTTA